MGASSSDYEIVTDLIINSILCADRVGCQLCTIKWLHRQLHNWTVAQMDMRIYNFCLGKMGCRESNGTAGFWRHHLIPTNRSFPIFCMYLILLGNHVRVLPMFTRAHFGPTVTTLPETWLYNSGTIHFTTTYHFLPVADAPIRFSQSPFLWDFSTMIKGTSLYKKVEVSRKSKTCPGRRPRDEWVSDRVSDRMSNEWVNEWIIEWVI